MKMTRRTLAKWIIACLLVLPFCPAVLADDDDNRPASLVGSWDVTFMDETQRVVATYHKDGGTVSTPGLASLTNAHGVWKRIGPRTFAVHTRFFNLDSNGLLLLVADDRSVIEVSKDGQSLTSTFELEISLPDGTVVGTQTGTTSGVRISVDF